MDLPITSVSFVIAHFRTTKGSRRNIRDGSTAVKCQNRKLSEIKPFVLHLVTFLIFFLFNVVLFLLKTDVPMI
jgi:hypothetical protein